MTTTEILTKAEKLVSDDRAKTHGDKIVNHENIARLFSAYLTNKFQAVININAEDVAQLMTLLKIARSQAGQHNIDDYVDGAAYMAIAGELKLERGEIMGEVTRQHVMKLNKENK